MLNINYIYSRCIKKLRGSAIKNSIVHHTSKIESGSDFICSEMERYSFCGYNCQIINTHIGSFCSLADNIVIGGARHPIEWASTSPVFYEGKDSVSVKFSNFRRNEDKKTLIGHDVWIGTGVTIIQGVSIGTGAVIGAGAVVTKDVPPYSIVGGNPAKIIRMRFDDNIIVGLLETQWWCLPNETLGKVSKFIKEPELFINAIKKERL